MGYYDRADDGGHGDDFTSDDDSLSLATEGGVPLGDDEDVLDEEVFLPDEEAFGFPDSNQEEEDDEENRRGCRSNQNRDFAYSGGASTRKPNKGRETRTRHARDREVFRRNLETLLHERRLRVPEAARRIGVEPRWFRRVVSRGLERSMPRLVRVAVYFELSGVEALWDPDLRADHVPPAPREDKIDHLRRRRSWPTARRLIDLLETGDYDDLAVLINRTYERDYLPRAGTVEAPPGGPCVSPTEGLGSRLRRRTLRHAD